MKVLMMLVLGLICMTAYANDKSAACMALVQRNSDACQKIKTYAQFSCIRELDRVLYREASESLIKSCAAHINLNGTSALKSYLIRVRRVSPSMVKLLGRIRTNAAGDCVKNFIYKERFNQIDKKLIRRCNKVGNRNL